MITKYIFIYACDEAAGTRMRNHIQNLDLNFKTDINICCTESDLKLQIRNCEKPVIICDKLKLGFKYTCTFDRIKNANKSAVIMVYGKDCNQKYLGYRLLRNNIDGYIENTGETESFLKALFSFLNAETYYPDYITEGHQLGDEKNNYNYTVEVSDNEMKVAIMNAQGYRAKEIAREINKENENNFKKKQICESTIYNQIMNVMRKCGLEKKNDILILYQQERLFANQN